PAVAGLPGIPNVNLAAPTQDIAIYLCPSDPFNAIRPADWVDNGDNSPAQFPEGRLNYFACIGTTGFGPSTSQLAGIFAGSWSGTSVLQGTTIVAITDGTSNTAMFGEVMRATEGWPHKSGFRDNTTLIAAGTGAETNNATAIGSCASGSPWSTSVSYV